MVNSRKSLILGVIIFSLLAGAYLHARQSVIQNGVEIKIALKKLLRLGSVLYIAAHPDDENTAVLSYMSSEKMMRSGYLSITRGGGGQNLIGAEKGSLMSVLRTYELLEARKIDGAEQFFTRAVDFGFSKTAKESMAIWGKENVLEDMVFVIRKFRPDVLITRFSPKRGGSGHGHHTASAILALEAFKAAGDATRFPKQLKYVSPWSPKRIFWNDWRPYWRPDEITPEEKKRLISIDVGTFNRLLGESYSEIAAASRSMHKSQGFGALPRRGQRLDFFNLMAGENAGEDLFEGIDTTWERIPHSEKVSELLEKANQTFQMEQPQKIIPLLMEALKELKTLPASYWTVQKTKELREVIRACTGLWIEAIADTYTVSPGQELKITFAVINRSGFPLNVKKLVLPGENLDINIDLPLQENFPFRKEFSMKIFEKEFTQPYWLKEKPQKGIFPAANHRFKGMAAAPYPFTIKAVLVWKDEEVEMETPVLYRWRDPVEGERLRKIVVSPPVTVNFAEDVFYFPDKRANTVNLILTGGPAPVKGEVKLKLPPDWQVEPAVIPFDILKPYIEQKVSFRVTPPDHDTACIVTAEVGVGGNTYHVGLTTIQYPHLPIITLHPKADARLVRVDLNGTGSKIGYIMGTGDDIPKYLIQVGYRVELLGDDDLQNIDLSKFDTIIAGIRAYNTRDILKQVQGRILEYVKNGGRLVMQYNVSRRFDFPQLGPYPLKLSSSRVCEEEAPVTILSPSHPLLNVPNKILPGDFEGWIQERGLYFANEWDPRYIPLFSCHDREEEARKGSLLFTRYGKGIFIYTGLSFFRQIPAGVPGALKLFVNLISSNGK